MNKLEDFLMRVVCTGGGLVGSSIQAVSDGELVAAFNQAIANSSFDSRKLGKELFKRKYKSLRASQSNDSGNLLLADMLAVFFNCSTIGGNNEKNS
ncbi:hypothetical protein A3Q34_03530 [Colwellia sp. PAMC 20917]|uniref:hypothetical protein n=1 Tax=Colwellia sp. PAMC 20917 TaxID=1816218 RepID=UPI00087889BF|nr:hypothetical protein [Colwellia sp. PAMC 20917]AOW76009.1 hypothetical protein A3Q34_03530 [Colwellia sp. PAMC 20917]